jgi:hypothetical protein
MVAEFCVNQAKFRCCLRQHQTPGGARMDGGATLVTSFRRPTREIIEIYIALADDICYNICRSRKDATALIRFPLKVIFA